MGKNKTNLRPQQTGKTEGFQLIKRKKKHLNKALNQECSVNIPRDAAAITVCCRAPPDITDRPSLPWWFFSIQGGTLLGPSRSHYTGPGALMWLQIESAQTSARNHGAQLGAGLILRCPCCERIFFNGLYKTFLYASHMLLLFP